MSLDSSARPGDLVCIEPDCPQFGKPTIGGFCTHCGQPTEVITGAVAASPHAATTTNTTVGTPAQISDRFVARLIDAAVVLAPLCVLGLCIYATGDTGGPATGSNPMLNVLVVAWYLFALLYEFFMLAARGGQTIGKQVMKIKVVKLDGQPIGWGSAASRVYVQSIASACTCGVAGLLFALSPLFDSSPWRRGWPDQLASTVVIRAGK